VPTKSKRRREPEPGDREPERKPEEHSSPSTRPSSLVPQAPRRATGTNSVGALTRRGTVASISCSSLSTCGDPKPEPPDRTQAQGVSRRGRTESKASAASAQGLRACLKYTPIFILSQEHQGSVLSNRNVRTITWHRRRVHESDGATARRPAIRRPDPRASWRYPAGSLWAGGNELRPVRMFA
jgi:hypothetical protein